MREALSDSNPSRLRSLLRGDLEAPDLADPTMPNDVQVTLRLPSDLVDRVDALLPALNRHPELLAFGRVSRSAVVRLALADGLRRLEARVAAADSEED